MSTTPTNPQADHERLTNEVAALLARLTEATAQHRGFEGTWGDVADLGRVKALLEEADHALTGASHAGI